MNLSKGYPWKDLELPPVEGSASRKNSLWKDRRQELVFIGINMDKDKILETLDEALLTDEEFVPGPVSWRSWTKLMTKDKHHHHGHHEHEDCTTSYAAESSTVHTFEASIIEDWFPEICDP